MYARLWALWLIAFLVIEASAALSKTPGQTLSEYVWGFLAGGPARYVLLGVFMAWLTIHFLARGRWG